MLPFQNAASNAQNPMITWGILGLAFLLMIIFMRRSGQKRLSQMEEQRKSMEQMMTPGTWVRTTSGFFGKVVEVSGEVITLANLTGEETLWDIRAIAKVEDPNFGTVSDSDSVTETDSVAADPEAPETKPEESGFGSNVEDNSTPGEDTEKGEGHTF
ncbi:MULTISPECIES: preprotein translocase subunit YajC [Mobiluncus]|uniref:Preprotein translocase, YajC subunit n=3 Tax=Mobiluncus TaxID=2050 RepID=A0A2X2YK64_9ACTO|nr:MULTISPECIES: preprotein translocase subunit YajC [Mobiluncus]SQB64504.1 preprotein translocase, YajC subunit [Mobiluncus curtisii]STY88795.1 preprotein translocase, YajC subunit [Mobiluncus holmesii]